jgi:hypothetical protein
MLIVCSMVLLCTTALGATREDLLRDLRNARSSWAEHGPTNYAFTMTTSCLCTSAPALGPVRITVTEGKAVRTVYIGPTRKGYTHGVLLAAETKMTSVPELFKEIEFAIATRPSKSASFSVQYNIVDGHPMRYQYDDSGSDDSFNVVLSDFQRR